VDGLEAGRRGERTIAGWKERLVLVGGWGDVVWGCMSDVCVVWGACVMCVCNA
jgi:hypothetical protein